MKKRKKNKRQRQKKEKLPKEQHTGKLSSNCLISHILIDPSSENVTI